MVKWFCCSAFCTNNFRKRNLQGESIKFYRLPRDHTRILQTTGVNWHSGHICTEHWSRGYRENATADFPDIPVPAYQLVALEKRLKQAKAQLERKATKPAKRNEVSSKGNFFCLSGCLSFLDLKKEKLQQKETTKLLKSQGTYLNDSYLLVWMRRKKMRSDWPSKTWSRHGKRTENLSLKIRMRNIEQPRGKVLNKMRNWRLL